MKGSAKVIDCLQEALKAELTAISQYILHAEMCDNWGYVRLGKATKMEAIGEMKHAEKLLERMLFLDGSPNMQELYPLKIGQTVKEQLENDLALEMEAIKRLNAGIAMSVAEHDNGSRELLEIILKDEEEHADRLEAQLHMIAEMGYPHYLSKQTEAEA